MSTATAAPPFTQEDRRKKLIGLLPYIDKMVNKLAGWAPQHVRDDLVGWARLGATVAMENYDPSYGTRASSYATPFIVGAIYDGLFLGQPVAADLTRSRRRVRTAVRDFVAEEPDTFEVVWDTEEENAERLDRFLARVFSSMYLELERGAQSPEEELLDQESRDRAGSIVSGALGRMSAPERRLYQMRYVQGMRLKEIAEDLGVDESTVRRHHNDLLDKVHGELSEQGIHERPQPGP